MMRFNELFHHKKRHRKLRHASTAQELNILLKQFDMAISLHTYSHVIPTAAIVCLFWPWIYVEFQGSSRTCSTFGGVLLSLTLDGNGQGFAQETAQWHQTECTNHILIICIYFGRGPPSSSDHKDILCTTCMKRASLMAVLSNGTDSNHHSLI